MDEGLHQFLQLKHGCKLSLVSLKSVFISNVTYFKKYTKLYGMTGTLGNLEERKKTTEIHKIDFVTLPRYREQKFQEYPSILMKNSNIWLKKITEEVAQRFHENRSILIICETIHDTKVIRKALLENSSTIPSSNVHIYQRDNEEFNIDEFKPKQVIVATNLASRGTDIKLSKALKEAGGLHVILAYLPQNARIENQAFGRASRAGDMGSGRLIICTDSARVSDITKLKETRNHNELQRLDEVNSYYQNFITIEEDFFGKFHAAYRELRLYGNKNLVILQVLSRDFVNSYRGLKEAVGTDAIKIYLENFKLQWSFWLDENSKKLEQRRAAKHDIKDICKEIDESFKKFISNPPEMHPVKQIELFKFYNDKKEFKKASGALKIDFQDDSIAFQYYKCYEIIKREQIRNGYENRKLRNDEEKELIKCLNMINERIQDRNIRVKIADSIKEQYKKSLITISGFENQQKILNEIDEIFIDSIQSFLGRSITHDTFVTPEIKLDVIRREILKEVTDRNILTKIKISEYYTNDDIRTISTKNNVRFVDFKDFLDSNQGKYIKSIGAFGETVKSSFKMPSREEFWDNSKEKQILTDEVKYVIIDMNTLKNVDPSIHEEIGKNFKHHELIVKLNTEIFFADIDNIKDDKSQFIMPLLQFKSQISSERFDFLMDNDVIKINKKATFSIEKFEQLKNEKIFKNFDSISRQDFKVICSDYDKIVEKLIKTHENGQKVLTERGDSFALNVENIDMLEITSEGSIFGDDEVYQPEVFNLIATKFAYRIALESLLRQIKDKKEAQNSKIHLLINPQLNIINDLIANNILILPKADKLNNIKSVCESLKYKFLETNRVIRNNYLGARPCNSVFTEDKTIKFLKDNFESAIKDFENIEKKIKESVQILSKEDIEKPDIILKPLDECLTDDKHHEMLELLKLKGFDMVIKVELKKYSGTYWFRFSIVIILGLIQLAIGAIVMIMSKGLFYHVGQSIMQEGIGDLIFALGTLRSGHFSWKDYGTHKIYSAITTFSLNAASFGLSKVKFLKKFFQSGDKINKHILENLTNENETVWKLMNSTEKIAIGSSTIGKGTRKTAFSLFSQQIYSNVGKAITQASIGMGADYILETYTNQITEHISKSIVDTLQKGFWDHDICDTIKSLLQYYNPSDL